MATGLSKLAVSAPALLIVIGVRSIAAQIATDGTAGPRVQLHGPEFAIGAELGTQAGRNLFHSFERFNLRTRADGTVERATFAGPDEIRNIISRVTGGERSDIDGTIKSTIAGADFYFINPAGIAFGPNASLDLQGSFHVSTADELRFKDGATFNARNPASSFTVARPEAFGFLGPEPASITVDRGFLFVLAGEALSIVGGDVGLAGGPGPSEGLIGGESNNVISVAALGQNTSFLLADGSVIGEQLRDVTMERQASVGALNAGTLRIIGQNVTLSNSDLLNTQSNNPSDAPALISIRAGVLTLTDGSNITGDVLCVAGPCAPGRGADIRIDADAVFILGEATIASATFEDKAGGDIRIASDVLVVIGRVDSSFSGITTGAQRGSSGPAGNISIVNAQLVFLGDDGQIMSSTFGSGPAGKITVDADILQLVNGGQIEASTMTDARGGQIVVEAKELLISGSGGSDITAVTAFSGFRLGRAGDVTIHADTVEITEGGNVSTFSFGGAAGMIDVHAMTIRIQDGSISSSSLGRGTAGTVTVEGTERLQLNRGEISTESASAGGGEIRLQVGDVIDLRDSEVTTSVQGGDDPTAGNIRIDPKILIIDGSVIKAEARGAPRGEGGEITIIADNILVPGGDFQALADRDDISATGGPAGVDGTIVVNAPEVDLSGGLVVLEGALLDAASQLRERCGARRDIGASSFTGVGRGGLPASPDAPLAGGYADADGRVGETPAKAASGRVDEAALPSSVRLVGLAPCRSWD